MKKITGLIAIVLLLVKTMSAQNTNGPGLVVQQIKNIEGAGIQFEKASLFTKATQLTNNYGVYQQFGIDKLKLRNLFKEHAEFIELSVPDAHGGEFKLMLKKHEALTDDFELTTTNGSEKTKMPMPDVVFYQGMIKNNMHSIVAITVFENEINGVIANEEGNFNLGKLKGTADEYALYNDKTLHLPIHFTCGNNNDNESTVYTREQLTGSPLTALSACQKIFFDCDFDFFQAFGIVNATNYVVSLFNVEGTLYNNEGINMAIHLINVWTVPDPYCSINSNCALNDFVAHYPLTGGDNILHLITMDGNGNGGLANGIGSLFCAAYSYSDIDGTFNSFPAYSWDAQVITHEMGHDLNSRHTHACVWNGNGTAIDGCGPAAGYAYEGSCSGAPIPASGTIMSYCHLSPNPGINFVNGFGPQPGSVIRSFINNAICFTNCTSACLHDIYVGSIVASGNTANYTASNTVFSATTLQSGSTVDFNGSNLVLLNPGFVAENGSTFHAYNGTCTPSPVPQPADALSSLKASDNNTGQHTINLMVKPNPFSSVTTISYNLKSDEKVNLKIYNTQMKQVACLINNSEEAKGAHQVQFNAENFPAGMYLCRLETSEGVTMIKIVLNK